MNSLIRSLLTNLVLYTFFLTSICQADPIYKRTDKDGKILYSSTPAHAQEKPVDLPAIVHENIGSRIQTIVAATAPSCAEHGEVDCGKGADTDGSVICLDGYRDARLPFRFTCLEARLQTEPLRLVDSEGHSTELATKKKHVEDITDLNDPRSFSPRALTLTIRNVTGIPALGVIVNFVIPGQKPIQAEGPTTVDAYGLADYTYKLDQLSGVQSTRSALVGAISKVNCQNCGAVLGPKR